MFNQNLFLFSLTYKKKGSTNLWRTFEILTYLFFSFSWFLRYLKWVIVWTRRTFLILEQFWIGNKFSKIKVHILRLIREENQDLLHQLARAIDSGIWLHGFRVISPGPGMFLQILGYFFRFWDISPDPGILCQNLGY